MNWADGRDSSTRGVSAVIAVILVLAVTVVLAGGVGTLVFDVGTSLSDDVTAGTSVEFEPDDAGGGEVTVTDVSRGNTDRLEINYTVRKSPDSNDLTRSGVEDLERPGDRLVLCEATGNADESIDVEVVVAFTSDERKAVVLEKSGSL